MNFNGHAVDLLLNVCHAHTILPADAIGKSAEAVARRTKPRHELSEEQLEDVPDALDREVRRRIPADGLLV